MRARIAAFDWSRTPLGAASAWPRSLNSAVATMLASPCPMLVWWGPDLTQLYNDAFVPVLSQLHPGGLGQPAAVCWAEAWPVVGALADAVMARGVFTWNERLEMATARNGIPEEAYMTFSYSPIRDETGAVGGLFCACTEDTERVLGGRRLAGLGALGEGAASAKTVAQACAAVAAVLAGMTRDLPFTLLYLLDEEQRLGRLVGHTGLPAGTSISALHVALGRDDGTWPFAEVLAQDRMVVVDDPSSAWEPTGPWPEPTRRAVVLPLANPAQAGLAGFLVAGISPRLALDRGYRTFLDLLSRQVAMALATARACEAERQRAGALAADDRAETDVLATVIDEFRTPLTLMLGPLGESLARTGLAARERERLGVVHRDGLRLLRLVDTLRDLSRVEEGRAVARFEPTDLAALTTDLASTFRSACEIAGLRLDVECPPLDRPVRVDRQMWETIVLNLLSDALECTQDGGVTVRLARRGDHAVLTVTNTGVGISEGGNPQVCDRFHRVEASAGRHRESSSLGLALVRELVRLHGGDVEVDGHPGQGTTSTVRVPFGVTAGPAAVRTELVGSTATRTDAIVPENQRRVPRHPGASPATRGGNASPDGAAGGERARILLVDHDADMRGYVRRLLEPRYRVEAVADSAEALARIEADPPDLVLSDVTVPRLDGFGLLRAIRTRPRLAGLPVILLSARAGGHAPIEGRDQGADDHLVKPFGARELLSRVATNLRLARLRQHADEATRASVALTEASTDVLYRVSPDWSQVRRLAGAGFLADTTEPDRDWLLASIPEADRPRVTAAIAEAVASGRAFELEHRMLRADGGVGWTLSRAVPSRNAAGDVIEWFGSASDIGARKAAEEKLRRNETQLRTMVAELQHRTRNLLLIVSAVAEQTAASSANVADFEERFNHRLAALGRVQGLLSREAAPDITLRALLELELVAHGVERGVRLRGPEVVLPTAAVQMLALALHEMTTNAVKHGALGRGGALDVSWSREGSEVTVDWVESGSPRAVAAAEAGFGLQLIRWMLPYELDARTSLAFTPDGLRCSISIGLDED